MTPLNCSSLLAANTGLIVHSAETILRLFLLMTNNLAFKPGQQYVHRRGRTLTQYDNLRWTFATLNTAQAHWNTEALKDYFGGAFERPIVNGTIVIAVVAGLTSEDIAQHSCGEVKLGKIAIRTPVFPGDTLWAISEILETTDALSRPDAGLMRYGITAVNQREQVVCSFERTVLLKRATHWSDRDAQFEQSKFCSG